MRLSTKGRFVLSAYNEVNEIRHSGKYNEVGIVSLAYLLGIGGLHIHISYCIESLYIQVVDIYGIFSYTV